MTKSTALDGRLFIVLICTFLAVVLFLSGVPYQLSQMPPH